VLLDARLRQVKEGERIARFDAEHDGVTFLAYFLLSPGQEPQITMPGQ
jgi:hypothetical protein